MNVRQTVYSCNLPLLFSKTALCRCCDYLCLMSMKSLWAMCAADSNHHWRADCTLRGGAFCMLQPRALRRIAFLAIVVWDTIVPLLSN